MHRLHSEVTNYTFLLKFGGKFELIGTQKGQIGLVFRFKLLKGTEKFLPQPGFEPRNLDYQSSVLPIMLPRALCLANLYIFILYYFDVGMLFGLMFTPHACLGSPTRWPARSELVRKDG